MREPDTKAAGAVAQFVGQTFRKYGAELHRYLLRRLRKPQDADDLAQEVFMRLLRLEDAEFVRKPQAYLYGVASHVVREFRMRTEQENDRLRFDSEVLEAAAEHPRGQPSPDEMAEQLSLRRQLDRALSRLPRMHRTVLLLLKRDGMSYEEAARATHLSVHTVEKYLFQAKAMMKTAKWDL
jgi:RNA polymerase sigma-70 factor (ECF subfamily)